MGLQSQLNDVSSDSIPLLLVAIIAGCVNYLRAFILRLLHSTGLSRFESDHLVNNDSSSEVIGSGLADLKLLAEQLNLNRDLSCRFGDDTTGGGGCDCVVCLCTFQDEDRVRRLDCRHVFHKDCFDGWLRQLYFTCPTCRAPLVHQQRVSLTRRRVGEDLVAWFLYR